MAKPQVFISCSSVDVSVTKRVVKWLEAHDIEGWFYKDRIPVGTPDWLDFVNDVIRNSVGLVLIATPNIRKSDAAHQEATLAYAAKIPIYPAQADGKALDECVWASFRYQAVDIRGNKFESGMTKLVEQILKDMKKQRQDHLALDKLLAARLGQDESDLLTSLGKERTRVSGLLGDLNDHKPVCVFLRNRIVRQFELIYMDNPHRREELKAFAYAFLYQQSAYEIASLLDTTPESVEILKMNALTFLREDKMLVSLVRDWLEVKC